LLTRSYYRVGAYSIALSNAYVVDVYKRDVGFKLFVQLVFLICTLVDVPQILAMSMPVAPFLTTFLSISLPQGLSLMHASVELRNDKEVRDTQNRTKGTAALRACVC